MLKHYMKTIQRSIDYMKKQGLSKEKIKKNLNNLSNRYEESKKDWKKELEKSKKENNIESIEFIENHLKTLTECQKFLNSWDD